MFIFVFIHSVEYIIYYNKVYKVYKRNLINASTRLLQKSNYKLSRYGKHSFSVAAADLWNALHVRLRTNVNYSYFKSNLLLIIRKN